MAAQQCVQLGYSPANTMGYFPNPQGENRNNSGRQDGPPAVGRTGTGQDSGRRFGSLPAQGNDAHPILRI